MRSPAKTGAGGRFLPENTAQGKPAAIGEAAPLG
jgi:hypothetical protein